MLIIHNYWMKFSNLAKRNPKMNDMLDYGNSKNNFTINKTRQLKPNASNKVSYIFSKKPFISISEYFWNIWYRGKDRKSQILEELRKTRKKLMKQALLKVLVTKFHSFNRLKTRIICLAKSSTRYFWAWNYELPWKCFTKLPK